MSLQWLLVEKCACSITSTWVKPEENPGDVTGVTATLRRECWNGGGYMTTVGGGVTGMTCDLQATVVNKQDLADIWFESL